MSHNAKVITAVILFACTLVAVPACSKSDSASGDKSPLAPGVPLEARSGLRMSKWGDEVGGLAVRATLPQEIEQGMPLDVTIELRCTPDHLRPGVSMLNTYPIPMKSKLLLTNVVTQEEFVVWPVDPMQGISLGIEHFLVPLDGPTIGPWTETFPLAPLIDAVTPGVYKFMLVYSQPEESSRRGLPERPDRDSSLPWVGEISSGMGELKILQATPRTMTLWLPNRLRVVRRRVVPGLAGGLEVTYRKSDADKITFPVRNGHYVGTLVRGGSGMELSNWAPRPGGRVAELLWYKGGDLKVSYEIEFFETCATVGHFWSPQSCEYKVLWTRSFDLDLSEEEVAAIQAE